jgi:sugar fermentation stimulation protein A
MNRPFTMPVPWTLVPAIFVDRPNRFLTHIRLGDQVQTAHLPDPGRLSELLIPGVDLLVQYSPGPTRKTHYTVHLVRRPGQDGWVCINTLLPNLFVEHLLKDHSLPILKNWTLAGREVTQGSSRFDFLLERDSQSLWLEVKSVTYAEEGVAQFPDAVSARGARHARHLAKLAQDGHPAMILFVIQRDDACLFRPMWDRDPDLGHALNVAHAAGVAIHAISINVTPEAFTLTGEIPVDLTPLAG